MQEIGMQLPYSIGDPLSLKTGVIPAPLSSVGTSPVCSIMCMLHMYNIQDTHFFSVTTMYFI